MYFVRSKDGPFSESLPTMKQQLNKMDQQCSGGLAMMQIFFLSIRYSFLQVRLASFD